MTTQTKTSNEIAETTNPKLDIRHPAMLRCEYGTGDVAKLLGLEIRLVRYWIDKGALVPEFHHGNGLGSRCYFSRRNILEAAILSVLSRFELAPTRMIEALAALRATNYFEWISFPNRTKEPSRIVWFGSDQFKILHPDEDVNELSRVGAGAYLVIDLPPIEAWVKQTVEGFETGAI